MQYEVIEGQIPFNKDLIEPGTYLFEISRAEELMSKNKVPMIKLTLKVKDKPDGGTWFVDYVSTKAPVKIKKFMEAIGLVDNYNGGQLTVEDCLGRKGHARFVHEYTDEYGIQNVISSYVSEGEDYE